MFRNQWFYQESWGQLSIEDNNFLQGSRELLFHQTEAIAAVMILACGRLDDRGAQYQKIKQKRK